MSSNWPEVSVEEIASSYPNALATGPFGSAISSKFFVEQGVPVIRGSNLSADVGGKLNDEGMVFVSHEKAKEFSRSIVRRGDLIFTCWGTINQIGMVHEDSRWDEYVISNKQMKLTVDQDKADPRFVYYVFSSPAKQQEILANGIGAAVPGFNLGQLKKHKFKLPPLDVQREIVAVLGCLDRRSDLNCQLNSTLEQMAQAIFKSWFIDFEPVKAKIASLEAEGSEEDALLAAMQAISGKSTEQLERLKAESPEQYAELEATAELFPSAMQESELGEIPEGWEVLPLSNMVDLIGGGTPKKTEPSYWNGDIRWFSVKDAPSAGDVFVIDTEDKITDAGLRDSSTKLLPLGTTIITARGTVGKLALTGVVTAMNQSCYGVVGSDGAGPYFNYLRLNRAIDVLKRNTHGAVFDTITRTTFETVVQPQPCLELRQRFEKVVEPVFETIKSNLHQSESLCELRDTLLPKLLSGELTIPDAKEQVAELQDVAHV